MFDWLTNRSELNAMTYHARRLQAEITTLHNYILSLREELKVAKSANSSPFTKADKKLLLKLCHPDKHGGCKQAEELFKRINAGWK